MNLNIIFRKDKYMNPLEYLEKLKNNIDKYKNINDRKNLISPIRFGEFEEISLDEYPEIKQIMEANKLNNK